MTINQRNVTAMAVAVAEEIERDTTRLRDQASAADLRFLAYLIDMAREEAKSIVKTSRRAIQRASSVD